MGTVGDAMERLADHLWRWTARHPEWHPGEFGRVVGCYTLSAPDAVVLVDPLLGDDAGPVLERLDGLVGDRLVIAVTVPYHVRSAEALWRRYAPRAETTIHGHPAAAKRLQDATGFRPLESGETLPGGVTAHAIGRPRRHEQPLHLASHRALAFGDAVVEVDGALRMWADRRVDEKVRRFYAERFAPTLEPLLALDVERVLVTHGEPVLEAGGEALAAALRRPPWYRHG
jgi:hypothetical protein